MVCGSHLPRVSCFHYRLRSRIFDQTDHTVSHRRGSYMSFASRAVEPVSKRRIQREWLHAEVSVGCSRDGIGLLCPDLIAAAGLDPAKRRVAKSSQRASFACRGEAKGTVKLLLWFIEGLRLIRRQVGTADQESRPCLVSFRLVHRRNRSCLLSKR